MICITAVSESPKYKIIIAAISDLVSLSKFLKAYRMETAIKPTARMQQWVLKFVIIWRFLLNTTRKRKQGDVYILAESGKIISST